MRLLELTIWLSLACVSLARPQEQVNVIGPDVVPAPGQAKIDNGSVENLTVDKKQEAISVTSRPNDKANDKFGGVTIQNDEGATSTVKPDSILEDLLRLIRHPELDFEVASNSIEYPSASRGQEDPIQIEVVGLDMDSSNFVNNEHGFFSRRRIMHEDPKESPKVRTSNRFRSPSNLIVIDEDLSESSEF